MNFALGNRLRAPAREQEEEVERLGRQVYRLRTADQVPRGFVECETTEACFKDGHRGCRAALPGVGWVPGAGQS